MHFVSKLSLMSNGETAPRGLTLRLGGPLAAADAAWETGQHRGDKHECFSRH
jgi:hypothetical protein